MRVLYPTDGRPPAVAAAELLTSLVDRRNVQVTVLYIDEYGNQLVADAAAAEVLDQALESIRGAGIDAEPKRSAGSRAIGGGVKHAMERELADGGYRLVVVGAGNTGRLGSLILGGVSTFVVHHSTVPTLVVHRSPIEGRDRLRLVVGTDGSAAAELSVDTLIAVASTQRCDVFVRSVVEPQTTPPPGLQAIATAPSDESERMLTEQGQDADRYVSAALERLARAGFRCDGDVVRGHAGVALLDAVRDRDADLVVVGTRGRGRIAGIALGSVSAHLVRTAPATLVTPGPDASAPGTSG